jgi:AraC-like DNA-binding protein
VECLSFVRMAAGVMGRLRTAGATALADLSTIQPRQDEAFIIDGREEGVAVTCPETLEVMRDMRKAIARRPSQRNDPDLHHDRDASMSIDVVLGIIGGLVPDRLVHQPPGKTAIGATSPVRPHELNSCLEANFVAALSLAMNQALMGSPRHLERLLPSHPAIQQLLRARSVANEMAREPARLYLRLLYSAILTWAVDRETIKWPDRQRGITPLPKWRFARVRKYIDLHLREPIRLPDLAKAAGLSRMHFAAQFRAYTGISPCTFVTMQRIQYARVLLGDPQRTLVDVALEVGFCTQAHFTTVFHRFVGHTPNCWRRAQSRENAEAIQ